jgi:hypothetical protein
MQSFLKHTKSIPELLMSAVMKPRRKAYLFAKHSDPQSNCAKTARQILSLLERKKDMTHQNELIKEEIWELLDHEKFLSEYNCCILSKMTLEELLRQMVNYKSSEDLIIFVEEMILEMEKKFGYELHPHLHSQQQLGIDVQALEYKHIGNGMEYLKQVHFTNMCNDKKNSFKASSFNNKSTKGSHGLSKTFLT